MLKKIICFLLVVALPVMAISQVQINIHEVLEGSSAEAQLESDLNFAKQSLENYAQSAEYRAALCSGDAVLGGGGFVLDLIGKFRAIPTGIRCAGGIAGGVGMLMGIAYGIFNISAETTRGEILDIHFFERFSRGIGV